MKLLVWMKCEGYSWLFGWISLNRDGCHLIFVLPFSSYSWNPSFVVVWFCLEPGLSFSPHLEHYHLHPQKSHHRKFLNSRNFLHCVLDVIVPPTFYLYQFPNCFLALISIAKRRYFKWNRSTPFDGKRVLRFSILVAIVLKNHRWSS